MPVILIRHGQSEGNLKRIFQGSLDYPLTDLGRDQARSVGKWLEQRGLHFDAVYSSPLSRAHETARILGGQTGNTEIHAHDMLREIHGGELEGLTHEQCIAKFPAYAERKLPEGADFSNYGGESYGQVNVRIMQFIEFIQQRHSEPDSILIVAHGGTLYQLFKRWCGWPVPTHFFVGMSNCVMICLEQREVLGHLGAQLKWMLPMELLDNSLTTEWRLADSPAEE
ncbi:histidine phosphatase family protein [bacterium]|nr:histidine phosphatase family protein [bacterium]